jgi:hypothetical protein
MTISKAEKIYKKARRLMHDNSSALLEVIYLCSVVINITDNEKLKSKAL